MTKPIWKKVSRAGFLGMLALVRATVELEEETVTFAYPECKMYYEKGSRIRDGSMYFLIHYYSECQPPPPDEESYHDEKTNTYHQYFYNEVKVNNES